MCKILCGKCLLVRPGTKHHIYPLRFFKNEAGKNGGIPLLWICRKCHDALELILPQHTQLTKQEYLQITREFLSEE